MRSIKRFTACLLLVIVSDPLPAQHTSSSINGLVRAASGEKLSGAFIKLNYEPGGTAWFTQSNRQGFYQFNNLQPGGPYSLEVSFIGFGTEKRTAVQLLLGEPMQLDISMQPETKALKEIVVASKKKINGTHAGQLVLDRERLELLTADGKNISDYLFYLPQARMLANNEGAVSFLGQNNRYNGFFIDGAINNDVFGLSASGTNGGQAGLSPVPVESIEQLQVNRTAYDASIGNYTGAGINAITRSGSNRQQKSVYYQSNIRPASLFQQQQNSRGEYYNNVYGLRLQGPMKQNRCFYFLNAELTRQEYPKFYDPANYTGSISSDAVMILINSLRSNYRYDAGDLYNNPELLAAARVVARLDWILDPGNSIVCSARFMDANKIFSNSSTPTVIHLSNDAFSLQTHSLSTSLEWRKRLRATASNRLLVTFTGIRDDRGPAGKPFPRVRIYDGDASIVFGTDNSSTINLLEQKNWSFTDHLNWMAGRHRLTSGLDAEYNQLRNAFIQNSFGNYSYNSLGDFLSNSSPSAYQLGFSMIDSIQNDRVKAAAVFNVLRAGFFLNDEVRLSASWQAGIGIRLDKHFFLTHPEGSRTIADSVLPVLAGYYDLQGAASGKVISIVPTVSPRFSFRGVLSSRLSIHGGIGIFSGRVPLAWPGGVYQLNGALTSGYAATGAVLNGIRFRADPYRQWQPAETGGVLNKAPVNLLAANFRMPTLLRGSLALENNFANGWRLMVEAVYSNNLSSVSYTNINLLPPSDHAVGPDKRPVYTTVNNGRIPLPNNAANPYDYIILLGNREGNCGNAWEITSSLRKLLAPGTVFEISHHYGHSTVLTDGTSSVNSSQWRTVESVAGRNELAISNSDFSAGHKISVWFSTAFRAGKTRFLASASYCGQSGSPFSYVYQNSITGDDGRSGSYDLVYIPTPAELKAMAFLPNLVRGLLFAPQQQQDALEEYIRSDPYLALHRGRYAARNACRTPSIHTVNLKLTANRKLTVSKKNYYLQFSIELQNLLNALNKRWGRQLVLPNDQLAIVSFAGFKSATDLTPQYRFDPGLLAIPAWKEGETGQSASLSYWSCRLGLRITW